MKAILPEPCASPGVADLVCRIADGDPEAEERLVELHSRGLSYLLRHLTRDPALADDLYQETFRVVLEKIRGGRLREPEKLAGFIRGTARNLALAEFRSAARRPENVAAALEPVDPSPGPLAHLVEEEDRRRLRVLLRELGDRDRQVLFRFHIAEEPKAAICADLSLNSRQFNLVLHRARRRFKKLVDESFASVVKSRDERRH